MKNTVRNISTLLFFVGNAFVGMADAANDQNLSLDARQMTEDFSPKAQYSRSQREAYAAQAEAIKDCKTLSKSERTDCQKAAKQQLKEDLASAGEVYKNAKK